MLFFHLKRSMTVESTVLKSVLPFLVKSVKNNIPNQETFIEQVFERPSFFFQNAHMTVSPQVIFFGKLVLLVNFEVYSKIQILLIQSRTNTVFCKSSKVPTCCNGTSLNVDASHSVKNSYVGICAWYYLG